MSSVNSMTVSSFSVDLFSEMFFFPLMFCCQLEALLISLLFLMKILKKCCGEI